MKYKLIKKPMQELSAIEQVLVNRGVPFNTISDYLNTTDSDIAHFSLLGMDRLKAAAIELIKVIKKNGKCLFVVDSDCDGMCSSSLGINYLYDAFPAWVRNNLTWYMHQGKQHGLSDVVQQVNVDEYDIIIVPDAGSNDYEQHKMLKEKGIVVIVLDHHEAPYLSEDAIVINNQMSDYPNKELSGVGVTWQFCRYLDTLLKTNYADDYVDLVSLGNTADMMSLLSIETKHLINKGLENIHNPFFKYMAEKNSFSLGSELTSWGVAFYIAPFVNAMLRSGTQEEKALLFNSMLKFKAFEMIQSTKRGTKPGDMEKVVDQAIRVATNVKNRQTRAQEAGLEFLENKIQEENLLDDKVLLIRVAPGQIDRNIAGLIANKFMAKYQRPCMILTKVTDENNNVSWQGSARGYDASGITNFKDICQDSGYAIFAEGHQGAFGFGIKEEHVSNFVSYMNEKFKYVSNEPVYYVDYIYTEQDINSQQIMDISTLDHIWGKDMNESMIAIEGLKITKDMLVMYAKKNITIKIAVGDVDVMLFKTSEDVFNQLYKESGYVEINLVGKCHLNEYFGRKTAQVFVSDFEIVDSSSYYF